MKNTILYGKKYYDDDDEEILFMRIIEKNPIEKKNVS